MDKQPAIAISCDYCGNVCDSDLINLNNKNFCCYGCATLSDVVANIKNAPLEVSLKYKQLDLEETFNKVVDYQNEDRYKIGISLPAIHCSSCIELLEDLPSFYDGILSSAVNFEQKRCTVTVSKDLPISFVAQLLDDLGYPPQISVSIKEKEIEKKLSKRTLLKLAVAGFCFGNIMLFSMPHYFGLELGNDVFFAKLFSALSIVLSFPVVFYAGREYLVSAYRALSAGKSHLNIPISIGILSLFGWSLYEILSGTGIGYLDSLAGLIFFLLIGKWFQHKIYDQVSYQRTVQEFIPLVVRKKTDAGFVWERLDKLEKEDSILVRNNETIPVNGLLTKGQAKIDYAFITGEAYPETVALRQQVYAGGCQLSGEIEIRLTEKPSLDKLWSTWSSQTTKEFENHWTDNISKYFTIAVLSIAFTAAFIWSFYSLPQALFVFSAVLIVACPCALALSAPFTYGNILRVFSRNNFFVKEANAIATFSELGHIVLDKTGTITEKSASEVRFIGNQLVDDQINLAYAIAHQSNHPLSQSVSQYLNPTKELVSSYYDEVIGKGIQGVVNGYHVKLGSATWITDTNAPGTKVYLSIDDEVLGYFEISTKYRNGLKGIFSSLGEKVKLSILSGDNDGERTNLESIYDNFQNLKFNLNPKQKSLEINRLKKTSKVLMIGDGLNDSSAIESGDLGIAITENLSGFYPGSDAVLLADSFDKLPAFLNLARYSKTILKFSLFFSLAYNLVGVAFAVSGMLTPIVAAILMPLSSISVVLLNTFLVRLKAKNLNLK